MKKAVLILTPIFVLSSRSFAGNCGFQNLVGEWTRKTELAAASDAQCGESVESEKTVFNFINKGGGKVLGSGSRVTIRTFQKKTDCSPKSKTFKYPYVELISNGSLSIMSENGAQVISDCNVSTDKSKLKIGNNLFFKTK